MTYPTSLDMATAGHYPCWRRNPPFGRITFLSCLWKWQSYSLSRLCPGHRRITPQQFICNSDHSVFTAHSIKMNLTQASCLMGFPDSGMGDDQAFVSALLDDNGPNSIISFPKFHSNLGDHLSHGQSEMGLSKSSEAHPKEEVPRGCFLWWSYFSARGWEWWLQ